MLAHFAHEHVYFAFIIVIHEEKVLDGRLLRPPKEIEHVALRLFVPLRLFIMELHQIYCFVRSQHALHRITLIGRVFEYVHVALSINFWKSDVQLPGTGIAEDVFHVVHDSVLSSRMHLLLN